MAAIRTEAYWSGVLALLGEPTSDGRVLQLADDAEREWTGQAVLLDGLDGRRTPVGEVTGMWVEGGEITGEGFVDLTRQPGQDVAALLVRPLHVAAGFGKLVFGSADQSVVVLPAGWTLVSALLVPPAEAVWPTTVIQLAGLPKGEAR